MVALGVDVIGADVLSAGMLAANAEIERGVEVIVRKNAELLRSTVRAKASGRPGPRVQTGDYRRKIAVNHGRAVSPRSGRLVPASTVRSPSPQAWRLERGFVGTDALGRLYNQPAYEHWGPALDIVEPKMFAEIEALTNSALDKATRAVLSSTLVRLARGI